MDMNFRPSFYDGDNSTDMWNMLAYASKNFPDFPHDLSEVHAYDFSYVPPNKGHFVTIPAAIFLSIALVVVGFRLWRRYLTRGPRLGADDWLMVAATVRFPT
jgi:hypothetical protein